MIMDLLIESMEINYESLGYSKINNFIFVVFLKVGINLVEVETEKAIALRLAYCTPVSCAVYICVKRVLGS